MRRRERRDRPWDDYLYQAVHAGGQGPRGHPCRLPASMAASLSTDLGERYRQPLDDRLGLVRQAGDEGRGRLAARQPDSLACP